VAFEVASSTPPLWHLRAPRSHRTPSSTAAEFVGPVRRPSSYGSPANPVRAQKRQIALRKSFVLMQLQTPHILCIVFLYAYKCPGGMPPILCNAAQKRPKLFLINTSSRAAYSVCVPSAAGDRARLVSVWRRALWSDAGRRALGIRGRSEDRRRNAAALDAGGAIVDDKKQKPKRGHF
jgi:hypothetical protein